MTARWQKPGRCGAGEGCGCETCSYARDMNPPRRTPTKRALRQYADVLDKMAAAEFDGWASFVAEVRRQSRAEVVH